MNISDLSAITLSTFDARQVTQMSQNIIEQAKSVEDILG